MRKNQQRKSDAKMTSFTQLNNITAAYSCEYCHKEALIDEF